VNPHRERLGPAAVAAVVLHLAALGWLLRLPSPPPPWTRLPPAKVRLVGRTPPPHAEAETKPPKPAEPQKAPRPAAGPARVSRAEPPPPPAAPAPLPAPRRFAVAMEATVPGGGVAVPTTEGPTAARGRADLPASVPVGQNPGPTALDVVEVERGPRAMRQPSPEDLRSLYPEEARREGLEADVKLELLVDEEGRVAEVKVMRPAGNGFDEAAVRAARGLGFSPATRGGRPVAVRIPWTLKFRLDG